MARLCPAPTSQGPPRSAEGHEQRHFICDGLVPCHHHFQVPASIAPQSKSPHPSLSSSWRSPVPGPRAVRAMVRRPAAAELQNWLHRCKGWRRTKRGPELGGQTGSGRVAAKKKNQCAEAFYSGAPPIFPFPFSLFPVPFSLFPGLPPTTASWFWHGASTDIRQWARPPPIARGRVRRSGISWPGAGKPTVDQTRFTATAASSPLKWSLLSPLASMFHVSQTPPHARGARATEPAPLVRIRHGSRHHVHDITCSGTGSGTAERHCSVVPRRPGKKDRTPADPEPDRRSTVLTVAITTSPSAAVSTQRCQILACEAIKSCLFIHKSQSGPQLLPCPMLRGRVYVMLLSARVAQEGSWPSPRHVHQVGLHPRCFPRPAQI